MIRSLYNSPVQTVNQHSILYPFSENPLKRIYGNKNPLNEYIWDQESFKRIYMGSRILKTNIYGIKNPLNEYIWDQESFQTKKFKEG